MGERSSKGMKHRQKDQPKHTSALHTDELLADDRWQNIWQMFSHLYLPFDLIRLGIGIINDAVQRNPSMVRKNGHFWHTSGSAGTHETGGRFLGNFLIVKPDPIRFPMLKEFLPRSEAVWDILWGGKNENPGVGNP